MKPNWYAIITDIIDRGIDVGWSRAHKHTDMPDPQVVKEAIYHEITNGLCEAIVFDDAEER